MIMNRVVTDDLDVEGDLLGAESVDTFAGEKSRVIEEDSFDAQSVIGRFVTLPPRFDTVTILNSNSFVSLLITD